LLVGLAGPLAFAGVPAQAARPATAPYDVDGDGRPELVVGAPGLTVSGHSFAGGITVVRPTTRTKPRASDATLVTQSTSGVAGASEHGDEFGSAVASADFDRDGYADLAVGLPGEDFSGKPDAGAVTILYGSKAGLTGYRCLTNPVSAKRKTRFTGLPCTRGEGRDDRVTPGVQDMASSLVIDQNSLTDNDRERQVEFTAEIDGDDRDFAVKFTGEIDGEDRDFAVKYAVLKELSGDEPEDDALELFERFSDEIVDVCAEAAMKKPSASLIVIDEGDLE
ncbi:MAG: DUF1488 family protein, partial [Sphingomonas sp.]